MRIDDLTDLAVPSQPALSPDGSRVVYVLRTLDADGRPQRRRSSGPCRHAGGTPRRLTRGTADTAPAWSPDGSQARVPPRRARCTSAAPPTAASRSRSPTCRSAPAPRCGARTAPGIAFTAPGRPGADAAPARVGRRRGSTTRPTAPGMFGAIRKQLHVRRPRHRASAARSPTATGTPASPAGRPTARTARLRRARSGTTATCASAPPSTCSTSTTRRRRPRVVAFADGVAGTVVVRRRRRQPARRRLAPATRSATPGCCASPLDGGDAVDLAGRPRPQRDARRPGLPGRAAAARPPTAGSLFCVRDRGCTHLYAVAARRRRAAPVLAGAGRVVAGLVGRRRHRGRRARHADVVRRDRRASTSPPARRRC